jgi:hypothetical protein
MIHKVTAAKHHQLVALGISIVTIIAIGIASQNMQHVHMFVH